MVMKSIRTIIIDDERYACERLKKLLAPFSQIRLIDFFTNSAQGLEFIQKYKPDLVFLDVELGNNVSAFDIIEKTGGTLHEPFFILITAHLHYSIRAIKHQVFDYILKPVDVDELEDTLDRLIRHIMIQPVKTMDSFNMLSNREKTILSYVLEGKSSREIAEILYISINTVNTHRRNILKKTGAGSSLELMRNNRLTHE
jgi:two-component system LytT family response regulator